VKNPHAETVSKEAGCHRWFKDVPGGLRRVKWLGNNKNRPKTHRLAVMMPSMCVLGWWGLGVMNVRGGGGNARWVQDVKWPSPIAT